jgi:phosphate butyryltransferase
MRKLSDIVALSKEIGPKKVAVAQAEDEEVLVALEQARCEGIVDVILVGKQEKIEELAGKNEIDTAKFEIKQEVDGFTASEGDSG